MIAGALVAALACAPAVPPELELAPPGSQAVDPEPDTPERRAAWALQGDPLARRVRQPLGVLPAGYAAFVALPPDADPPDVWRLELAAGGTESRALARGARLAAAETALAEPGRLLRWVVPLAEPGEALVADLRPPYAWAGVDRAEALLPVLERGVLLGWLDAPSVDAGPAAALLADPRWARLATTPVGRLVVARGRGGTDPGDPAGLASATALALAEAAADRPEEHAAVREVRRSLGVGESGDGVAELLVHSLVATPEAPDGPALGRALLAHGALRWRGRCDDSPCGGFDRIEQVAAGGRFGAVADAAVWRVVAWKGATDELWAAWDRPQVTRAMDRVVELVAADQPRALDLSALARPGPDAGWILPVTRALGVEGTSREALFRALYGKVAAEATAAARVAPEHAGPLGVIARRAGRAAQP